MPASRIERMKRGPVKRPQRTLEKVQSSYVLKMSRALWETRNFVVFSCALPLSTDPTSCLQQVTRKFRRDASRLTDLVRCTCVLHSPEEVLSFAETIMNMSQIGIMDTHADSAASVKPLMPNLRGGNVASQGSEHTNSKQLFRMCTISNRFDPDYDVSKSAGYRDMSMDVEVRARLNMSVPCRQAR